MSFANTVNGEPQELKVTSYDVFLAVAGHSAAVTLEDIKKQLWLKSEVQILAHLATLLEDKLIVQEGQSYTGSHTARANVLFEFLAYAVAYDYDYNAYLAPDMLELLKRTYGLDVFSDRDVKGVNGLSLNYYRLLVNNHIVFFRYSPLLARIVQGPFIDQLFAFMGLKPIRKLFSFRFNIDLAIMEKLMAFQKHDLEQISWGSKLFFEPGRPHPDLALPKPQKILKFDVVPENPELFNKNVQQNYEIAYNKMLYNVRRRQDLSLEVIHDYHLLAMKDSGIPSELRTHEVEVRNNPYFIVASPKNIQSRLNSFMEEYRKRATKAKRLINALELAAYVYNEFLYIHPFEDGNTRTAMLAMCHVLGLHNAVIKAIPKSYDYRFLQVTKGAKKRDDRNLFNLLKEVLVAVLNNSERAQMESI